MGSNIHSNSLVLLVTLELTHKPRRGAAALVVVSDADVWLIKESCMSSVIIYFNVRISFFGR